MCLVILILPLAQLMKNLKAHGYCNGKRFLPFSDPSEVGQGSRLRMTRMAFPEPEPKCAVIAIFRVFVLPDGLTETRKRYKQI